MKKEEAFIQEYFQEKWKSLKEKDSSFSIRKAVSKVGNISPALVTQVLNGKRKLKRDKLPAFANIFRLKKNELRYIDELLIDIGVPKSRNIEDDPKPKKHRSKPSNYLLKDWLNLYVKDVVNLKEFKEDPKEIYQLLGGIASLKRIERSLSFLKQEGYLRRNLQGKLIQNEAITTTTDEGPVKDSIESQIETGLGLVVVNWIVLLMA